MLHAWDQYAKDHTVGRTHFYSENMHAVWHIAAFSQVSRALEMVRLVAVFNLNFV